MSQNRKDFQSKPRFGGQKPGGRKGGGKSFGDKPRGRDFDKRSEGDRGPSRGGERDARFHKGRDGEGKGGGFGKKPRFDGERRPRGEFGDKKFGDRKPRDRDFGDRKGGGKPFGDKKFGDKKFGDRKPRDRDFGDRKGGGKPFGDRKFDGERRPRREFDSARPRREFDNARPRREFDNTRPRRDFDRDRPRRDFDSSESRGPASFETREKLKSGRASYGAPSSAYLYGVHAVRAALLNPKRQHQRLLCTVSGFESIAGACQQALDAGLSIPDAVYVEKEDISRLLPRDAVHQDVLLDSQPPEEVFLSDILVSAGDDAKVVVLDQVTDPHNVGAILRSAAAFGALAVIVQKLHAPEITGTVAKAASGAAEHVPLVREVNLSRALEQLKEAGFFCIGLAEEGKDTLAKLNPKGKVALVMGAEGEGLRRLVAQNCDTLARLPTGGPVGSLNVSNAAAVALYEVARNGK